MSKVIFALVVLSAIIGLVACDRAQAEEHSAVLTGAAAFGDWRTDSPGIRRRITSADLPPPFATESAGNPPRIVPRPSGATLKVPAGFVVEEFANGLDQPRLVRVAPNGDIFISESRAGRVRVLRAADGASKPSSTKAAVVAFSNFVLKFCAAAVIPVFKVKYALLHAEKTKRRIQPMMSAILRHFRRGTANALALRMWNFFSVRLSMDAGFGSLDFTEHPLFPHVSEFQGDYEEGGSYPHPRQARRGQRDADAARLPANRGFRGQQLTKP